MKVATEKRETERGAEQHDGDSSQVLFNARFGIARGAAKWSPR